MKINITTHPTRAGWYYLDFRPDGYKLPDGSKAKRVRIPVEGYDRAVILRDQLEEKYATPDRKVDTHPRLSEVYEEYLEWVKEHQSPSTYRTKSHAFKERIIPHFGSYRVKDLTLPIFDQFHKTLKGKRRAIIMYQHYLSAMIKWMVKRGMAKPLDFKPEEPKYKAGKPVIPSMKDIQGIIDSIKSEEKKALLHAMLWAGLRWNEVRLLKWEDVYLDQKIIRVRESDQEDEVHIAIWPEQVKWLKKNKKPSGYIWTNPKTHRPYTSLRTILRSASLKLKTNITHHDFRRRSGQNVYEASGWDIFAAQRHLRHQDIRTTMRYLGVDDQRRAQVFDSVVKHVEKLRKDNGKPGKSKALRTRAAKTGQFQKT